MNQPGVLRWLVAHIRGYVILWSVSALLLVLGLVATYSYTAYRSAAAELVIERDLQLAYLSAARLEDELTKFSDDLEALARTDAMRSSEPGDRQEALEGAQLSLSAFDAGILLLDETGAIRASYPARPLDIGRDWSDRPYFRRLLGANRVVFADTETDGPDGTPAVVVSVPIIGGSGELLGALVGMFRLGQATISPFYASIIRLRIGQSGDTYLVGSRRQILYDSAVQHVGEPFSVRALPGLVLGPQGGALRTHDAEGHEVLAAYVPVPGTPWWLVTEDDWATLTRSTRPYLRMFLAVVSLGMLVPAVGLGLLARQQRSGIVDRARDDYEAQVAQLIQSTLVPEDVPHVPGWRITAEFQTADTGPCAFYDWLLLDDGNLMIACADVTEKRAAGVPIMATTRAVLRAAAMRGLEPCEALEEANAILSADMPAGIAVSCLQTVLDPASGELSFATAGHTAPLRCGDGGLIETESEGRRLGVDLSRAYVTHSFVIEPGSYAILCNAGLLEARNRAGERFGDHRLPAIARDHSGEGRELAKAVQADFRDFMGGGWQPDADMTLIIVERLGRDRDDLDAGPESRGRGR